MLRILIIILLSSTTLHAQTAEDKKINTYKDSIKYVSEHQGIWLRKLGQAYLKYNQYDSSKKYFNKALVSKSINNNADQKASILNNLGVLYYSLGHVDSCIIYYEKGKELYLKINDLTSAAYTEINLGIIYKDLGDYNQSLENLFSAAELLEKSIGQGDALSSCYNTIASVYSRQNDFNNALLYYKMGLKGRKNLFLHKDIAASYNNLGIIFRKIKSYDSAVYYFNKSLAIKETLNDIKGKGATYNNIGRVLLDQKKYTLAKPYFLKSLQFRTESSDKAGKAVTLNNIGLLYYLKKQPEQALYFLDEASILLDKLGLLEDLKDNLEIKLQVYEHLGFINSAFEISKQLMLVKDSLYNKDKIQSLIEMQTKYETDKKVKEIALLEQKQALQQAELNLTQAWMWIMALIILLIILVVFLFYSRWKKEKLSKQNIETLMQELHHRVKNNLQLLSSIFSLQSRAVRDQGLRDAVKSGENRVNAMAIIHQKLYAKTGARSINIKPYLTDLIEELAESYGHSIENGNIFINIDDIEMDVDKVIPLGLIVNELVSNAFKYAFSNIISPFLLVEIIQKDNFIILKVADNGNGFEHNGKTEKSMGLNIVETLSRQLKAKTQWTTNGQVIFNLHLTLND